MKCVSALGKGLFLLFVFSTTVLSANVPLRAVVKGELLGTRFSPSNLLHESDGSNDFARAAFCASSALAGGCAGWLASGTTVGTVLCSLSAGTAAFIHSYYDTRGFSVYFGSAPILESPEFPSNQRYVPLLRTLLRGGDLRLKSKQETILHRPNLQVIGAFTFVEIPLEVLSEKQMAEGKKPRTQRVQVVALSSVLVTVGDKTYSFDELEPAPREWEETPLFLE